MWVGGEREEIDGSEASSRAVLRTHWTVFVTRRIGVNEDSKVFVSSSRIRHEECRGRGRTAPLF